jgi:hypothetical protein
MWRAAPVRAALDSCSIGVAPTSVAPNTTTDFSFGIYNGNSNPIAWLEVTRPAGNYVTLQNGSASGWDATVGSDTVTFGNGSLGTGYSQGFDVQAVSRSSNGGPVAWTVRASDNSDGSGAITCDGDTSLTIATQPSVINITNVRVSSVDSTAITVLWDTDVPSTSQVQYGEDPTYGSMSSLSGTLVTSHSVRLTGLRADTGYHYQVMSTTPADGGSASSGDGTFLTAAAPTEVVVQVPVAVPGSTGTIGQIGPQLETVPPTVTVATKLTGAYATPPSISGTASDNVAVAKLEYSTDGGKNWAGVPKVEPTVTTTTTGKGKAKHTTTETSTAKVNFSFVPVLTDDGNYVVLVRATDSSGNQAMSAPMTLVIDRLPPRFGGELVAFGSQAAQPDALGRWQAILGLDQTITLGAVGGPTEVTIEALKAGTKQVAHTFNLRRDADSGLWRGVLSFGTVGDYQLEVAAVDGAGNRVRQLLSVVQVSAPARVVGPNAKGVKNAKVTLYYRLPGSRAWVVWDGEAFGQSNPQQTSDSGGFQMLVPAGTYYLKAEAKGYETVVTREFTLDRPTPLLPVVKLTARPRLGPFELPWVSVRRVEIQPTAKGAQATASIVGHSLPSFNLPSTGGGTVSMVGLLGKPTLVTVLSTWAPAMSEQLPALEQLQANHDLNIVPLVLGERSSRVQAYLGRAGSDLSMVIDADATLGLALGAPNLPTHYVLDRKGIVRAVFTGAVPAQVLLDKLGS